MAELFENSYFSVLPNEVLINILGQVDTVTLFKFCELYQCEFFLRERNVIKTLGLQRAYALMDLSFSQKIEPQFVTSLNVNCIYWIPGNALRAFVKELVNLETLLAIHTTLSLTSIDLLVFAKSKIRKLGVSVGRGDVQKYHKVPNVQTLYVHLVTISDLGTPMNLETMFPELHHLWIDVEEACGREILLHSLKGHVKNKIFCQVNAPVPSIRFEHYWLTTYYHNRRIGQPYIMCCEMLSLALNRPLIYQFGALGDSWRVLDELHCFKPYGPKDARRLYLSKSSREDFLFEELNFYHSRANCNERWRRAVKEILNSRSAKNLKKLCVTMCLFANRNAHQESTAHNSLVFLKKPRTGVPSSVKNHPARAIFRNFPKLQHLEVYACNHISHHTAIQAYPLIASLSELQSLTLEIPVTLDGSFLFEVFQVCKRLTRLRITSSSQNEKFNYCLAGSICSATSLKDFRFEAYKIQMDRLLDRMSALKNLERVVLICEDIDRFTSMILQQFLDANLNINFLYFVIRKLTEVSMRMIRQTLQFYQKLHPSKVFLFRKTDVDRMGFPVPDVHYCEMVKCDINVASLDPLEHFQEF